MNQKVSSITVVGTGALATYYSLRLTSKFDVLVLGSWEEGIRGINAYPSISNEQLEAKGEIIACNNWEDTLFSQNVICFVKTYQNKKVLTRLNALNRDLNILMVQNGFENEGELNALYPNLNIEIGVTNQGAKLIKPGVVENTGAGPIQLRKGSGFISELEQAGIDTLEVDDLNKVRLVKLAINSVVNPLTALYGVLNGGLLERKKEVSDMIETLFPFFEGKCFNTTNEYLDLVFKVCENTTANVNSMLSDVRRGGPTEIHEILGPIQKELQSSKLDDLIKEIESVAKNFR